MLRFRSIAGQLTSRVILSTLLMCIAIIVVQCLIVVWEQQNKFADQRTRVFDLVSIPAAQAVWTIDQIAAEGVIRSLRSIDSVASARLYDGSSLFVEYSADKTHSNLMTGLSHIAFGDLITQTIQLAPPANTNAAAVIGRLDIVYDGTVFAGELLTVMASATSLSILLVAVVAFVSVLATHRTVAKPLWRLTEQLVSIDLDRIDPEGLQVKKKHQDNELGQIAAAFRKVLSRVRDNQRELERLATTDNLTGLPNRALLQAELERRIPAANASNEKFAVLFLDLDRFKMVNDSLGHTAGDELLGHLGRELKDLISAYGMVGRLGGDEFVIITAPLLTGSAAAEIAQEVLATLNRPVLIGATLIHPSASVGISLYPEDGWDSNDLLRHADTAMYHAKKAGNSWAFFQPQMTESARTRLELESALRQAIEQDELELFYQPKVCSRTKRIAGAEALVRWRRDGAIISPGAFIPMAEETGLIVPLGAWVIDEAARQLAVWNYKIPISINVAPRQLTDDDVPARLQEALDKYSVPRGRIEVELTETALADENADQMAALRSLGVSVSIDDFGTGYSNLGYLNKLPLDTLKIDRSFSSQVPNDPTIAQMILVMSKALGLSVVAEGIETQEQFDWMADEKCDLIQGYLISEPLPAEEFEKTFLRGDVAVVPAPTA